MNGQPDDGNTTEVVEIPNPFQEFRTYAEARDAAGYDFAAPEKVDGYPNVSYGVMDGGGMEYDALLTLAVGIQTGEAAQKNDASAEGAWTVNAGEASPDDNPAAMSAFKKRLTPFTSVGLSGRSDS